MGYKNIEDFLPHDLVCAIQQYIDGGYFYVPRKAGCKRLWGESTQIRQIRSDRNREIVARRLAGYSVHDLAEAYFLSSKTIYKILNAAKRS